MPTRAILPEMKLSSTNDCSYMEEEEEVTESYVPTTESTNIRLIVCQKRCPPYLVNRNVTDHVVRTEQRVG